MDKLNDLKERLVEIIDGRTDLRPFVCDGSPLDCKVFLIGNNPATKMSTDFWDFWDSEYGFHKSAWYEAYKADRQGEPKSTSPTRERINRIVENASPVKILETNIYAAPTKKKADLNLEQQTTEIFTFLLKTIRPQIIVPYGKKAVQYVQSNDIKAFIEEIKASVIPINDVTKTKKEKHLISVSYGDACALGAQIKRKYVA